MSKAHVAFSLVSSLFLLGAVSAADLYRFPTGNTTWAVSIRYATSAQQPDDSSQGAQGGGDANQPMTSAMPQTAKMPPRPIRIECASYQGIERYKIAFDNGKNEEFWKQQGVILTRNESLKRVGISSGMVDTGVIGTVGASIFSWIPSAAPGTEALVDKRKCLFYQKAPSTNDIGTFIDVEKLRPRQAWIDQETLLPLAYNNGVATFRFAYGPPPPGPLEVPPDIAKMAARIANATSVSNGAGKPVKAAAGN